MRDPHIVDLTYQLVTASDVSFNSPAPVEFQNSVGHFLLSDDVLTVSLREHFSSVQEPRDAVEGVLRAWVLLAGISSSAGRIRFEYLTNTILDRDPPAPGEPQSILLEGMSTIHVTDSVSAHVGVANYPDPPTNFLVTPDVEAVCNRWLAQRAGTEPLLAASYYILSVLEERLGKRAGAAE